MEPNTTGIGDSYDQMRKHPYMVKQQGDFQLQNHEVAQGRGQET